jgi:hypothetical protein
MLSNMERLFLNNRRVAHLATADRRAAPHVVPVCFAMSNDTLYVTIDEKPKRSEAGLAGRFCGWVIVNADHSGA